MEEKGKVNATASVKMRPEVLKRRLYEFCNDPQRRIYIIAINRILEVAPIEAMIVNPDGTWETKMRAADEDKINFLKEKLSEYENTMYADILITKQG